MTPAEPLGTLVFWVNGPDNEAGGGGRVGRDWRGTIIGDQIVICGPMPANSVGVRAVVGRSAIVPVHMASEVFVVVAPRTEKVTVTFRDAKGRVVKKLRIPRMPTLPDRETSLRALGLVEDPAYVPEPPEPQSEEARTDVSALLKRYGLRDIIVKTPVDNEIAALYQQQHTGKAWLSVTGDSGILMPLDVCFSSQVHYAGDNLVIAGPLIPTAVTAKASTGTGTPLPVQLAAGWFLLVAPAVHDVHITFQNAKGKRVWQHDIAPRGRQITPSIIQIYRDWLRFLWLRQRERWNLARR